MILVTLYTIAQETNAVPRKVPYYQIHEYRGHPNSLVNHGNAARMMDEHVHTIDIPIETIRYPDGRPDEFIAVHPRLKEILTLDVRQKLEEKCAQLQRSEHWCAKLQDNYRNWWSQPWYKRVWQALKGTKL